MHCAIYHATTTTTNNNNNNKNKNKNYKNTISKTRDKLEWFFNAMHGLDIVTFDIVTMRH